MDSNSNLAALADAPVAVMARTSVPGGGALAALREVSLQVARGEIVSLLDAWPAGAPSAARTVLAAFAGFAPAEAGVITLDDRLLDSVPPHKRGVGLVPRPLSLFPHLTVAAHARFAPGLKRTEAADIMQRLGLIEVAAKRPSALPPFAQFRTALARALSPAPTLLLLDDPLAALPERDRLPAKDLLRRLAAELGVAVLHSTEDAALAYGLSHRIAVFQGGRIAQTGSVQELHDRPASPEIARVLGPVNLLAGTVVDSEDDTARIRLENGAVVEARTHAPLADGAKCTVALRPERVAVAAFLATDVGEGALPATLRDTVFDGDRWRLAFRLDGMPDSAPDLIVTRPASIPPPRGANMSLAWQAHHATAYPAAEAAS